MTNSNQVVHGVKTKAGLILLFSLFISIVGYSQTTLDGSFMHDGILRTYRVYIPAVYNPDVPVPLLFNLHGYGSNNIEQEIYGDFRPIADTADFIIVHPNGTFDFQNNRFWNTFGTSTVDDIGFLSALIDTLSADFAIDQNRIYSTGMSNGGFMSYELACGLSDRIAAIASVTGSMTFAHMNLCDARHPTPVMEIHGTADATVPYIGNTLFVPVDTLVNFWVQFNNCSIIPSVNQLPDINTLDGCTAELYVYDGGDLGSKVELYKIIGGGHTWPGAPVIVGVTNMDLSASAEIWRFFTRYDLNGLITTGVEARIEQAYSYKVYPNPGKNNFTIDLPGSSEKTILITDFMGRLVQRFTCSGNKAYLNIENKGLYFITVSANNNTSTEKVISY
ncbi:MAG: T9SS type A sorting domain-containing protein [Bacteroidota bacterium]